MAILGFEGTSGSVSLEPVRVLMPRGIEVEVTMGQSWDDADRIQFESDGNLGGVLPDEGFGKTVENLHALNKWRLHRATQGEKETDAVDLELEFAKQKLRSMCGAGASGGDVWREP